MASLDLFRNVINTVAFAQGEVIFQEGDPGDVMYLVKEGQVEIKNGETILTTFHPGDMFGEMALISKEPRSATAAAKTDCTLLPVDEEKFLYLVQHTPYFSLHVMSVLAQRLRALLENRAQ